ncbi:MAG: septum formation initiator family protein [Candidatus Paceibacterota bacterium]
MRNLQGKRNYKRFFESWPVLIFLAIATIFFTWQIIDFFGKLRDTRYNRQTAEDRLTALKESKQNLSDSIESLKTPEGIDESIRNKFGLAKEGEGVIIIVEDQNAQKKSDSDDGNWFSNLWGKIFR